MHGRNVNNVSSGGVGRRGRSSSLALQSGHRRAAPRRLAVVVNAAATDDADDDDVNPRSNYTETSGAVKGLVSGGGWMVKSLCGHRSIQYLFSSECCAHGVLSIELPTCLDPDHY